METQKITMSTDIGVSAQKVFDFITDPNNIPSVLPGLVENSNIPSLPLVPGATFDFTYQMYGVNFEGVCTVLEIVSPRLYKNHTTGGIESNWTSEIEESEGGCRVVLTVEYEIPSGLFGSLMIHQVIG